WMRQENEAGVQESGQWNKTAADAHDGVGEAGPAGDATNARGKEAGVRNPQRQDPFDYSLAGECQAARMDIRRKRTGRGVIPRKRGRDDWCQQFRAAERHVDPVAGERVVKLGG